ncbi:MAG: Asp-tRNA(Asn)/Glu-tRNA(Gln) amidotransferase subunit GatC [Patescibacteria group bacterium]
MITQDEVKKIADLARLHLSDAELGEYSANISGILENFETIRTIDTKNVASADDTSGLQNVTREDVAYENILGTPEQLLKNAKTKNGYVVVPAIFSDIEAV